MIVIGLALPELLERNSILGDLGGGNGELSSFDPDPLGAPLRGCMCRKTSSVFQSAPFALAL